MNASVPIPSPAGSAPFGRVITAMVTPFDAEGGRCRRRCQGNGGVHGVFPGGGAISRSAI